MIGRQRQSTFQRNSSRSGLRRCWSLYEFLIVSAVDSHRYFMLTRSTLRQGIELIDSMTAAGWQVGRTSIGVTGRCGGRLGCDSRGACCTRTLHDALNPGDEPRLLAPSISRITGLAEGRMRVLERPSALLGDFSPWLAPTATTAYEISQDHRSRTGRRAFGRAIHLHRSVARIARDQRAETVDLQIEEPLHPAQRRVDVLDQPVSMKVQPRVRRANDAAAGRSPSLVPIAVTLRYPKGGYTR